MGSFGENLRREREMRGVTLEEIAESTKISTRLLRALEQEHFSALPGGVFTRSFIRHYADYLGLDSEHVLAEYRQVAPENVYDLNRLPAGTSFSSKPTTRGSAIPWVVAAVLLGGGYATYRYAHRPIETSVPALPTSAASVAPSGPDGATTSAANALAPEGAAQPGGSANAASLGTESATHSAGAASPNRGENPPVARQSPDDDTSGTQSATGQEAASSSRTATSSPGANATATAPVLGDGGLVLKVATTEDAWLAVAADGKTLMQRTLPANTVRTFRANDAFDVTTGNAEGTSLTLNGAPLKPLGRHGEFRKVRLTRDGIPGSAKPPATPSN
jgi:cytoskeleton protein RodZ